VVLIAPLCTAVMPQERAPTVLVLGGNGFIGAEFVVELLESSGQHSQRRPDVTVVNRGNHYWDSAQRLQGARIVHCDRDRWAKCDLPGAYDYAVDFSANERRHVTSTLEALSGRVGRYLLVSTGAVYIPSAPVIFGSLHEDDCALGQRSGLRGWLRELDGYAKRKLEIEEEAMSFSDNVSVVILRPSYVIGSRDSTHRLALYNLWVRLERPRLPWGASQVLLSFVDAKSVASALMFLMEAPLPSVAGEAFNVALPPVTFGEVLAEIARTVGAENLATVSIELLGSPLAYVYDAVKFAAVFRFVLDCSKLRKLGWQPTTPDTLKAVSEAARFVEAELLPRTSRFQTERNQIADRFISKADGGSEHDSARTLVLTLLNGTTAAEQLADDSRFLENWERKRLRNSLLTRIVPILLSSPGSLLLTVLLAPALVYSAAKTLASLPMLLAGILPMLAYVIHCFGGQRFELKNAGDVANHGSADLHMLVFGERRTNWEDIRVWLFITFHEVYEFCGLVACLLFCARGLALHGRPFMNPCAGPGLSRALSVRTLLASLQIMVFFFVGQKLVLPRLYGEEGLGVERPKYESELPVVLISHEAVSDTVCVLMILVCWGFVALSHLVMARRAVIFAAEGSRGSGITLAAFVVGYMNAAVFETHHMDDPRKAITSAAAFASLFSMWVVFSVLPCMAVFAAFHVSSKAATIVQVMKHQ